MAATSTTSSCRGCCTPAFVRSPHPHAKIVSIDIEAAKQRAGRRGGADRERHQPALRAVRRRRIASAGPSFRAATAAGRGPRRLAGPARRGGRRRQPGRGGGRGRTGDVDWEPLPAVGDQLAGHRCRARPSSIPSSRDNVAFDFSIEKGEPAKAFAEADIVIEEELRFERQMAMTLEARGLIADFDPSEGTLTVIHAHQSPFQMQEVFSRHLRHSRAQGARDRAGHRRRASA